MPQRTRHEWVSNEVGTRDLLNALGGDLLYYNKLGSDGTINGDGSEHVISDGTITFQTSLTVGSPRVLLLFCSGQVDTTNDTVHCSTYFNVAPPNSPGTFTRVDQAFDALGFTDANGTKRHAEWKSGFTYHVGALAGTYSFQMTAANGGTASAGNPLIKAGFRFMILDAGSAF